MRTANAGSKGPLSCDVDLVLVPKSIDLHRRRLLDSSAAGKDLRLNGSKTKDQLSRGANKQFFGIDT